MSRIDRDVVLAFSVNVVAGLAVFLLTKSALYALCVLVLFQSVAILVLWTRLRRQGSELGIASSAPSSPEGAGFVLLTDRVTNGFAFWGISAKSLLSNDTFNGLMIRKARGSCVFRFLILSPTSRHVALKAVEEGDSPEGWKNEIEANIIRLRSFREEHHVNIEVRVYDQAPTFRGLFINSDMLYLGWYPPGAQGRHSPFLHLRNSEASLYHPIRSEFEDLWARSGAAD
jgi:hypothetical protein